MSATAPKWLQEYYGPDFDMLQPEVVHQGKTKAIVRLMRATRIKGSFSSVGYVLIHIGGRHVATPHKSLHEGVASAEDLEKMKKVLAKEEES
jgi:hypothetical protein